MSTLRPRQEEKVKIIEVVKEDMKQLDMVEIRHKTKLEVDMREVKIMR